MLLSGNENLQPDNEDGLMAQVLKLVQGTSVVIVFKSKPFPRNGYGALRQLKPNHKKSS